MSTSTEHVDLVLALDDPRIAWQPLHHQLEELDRAGVIPHRRHALSDRDLARIDHDVGGTFSARMLHGGAWLFEEKTKGSVPFVCGEPVSSHQQPPESPDDITADSGVSPNSLVETRLIGCAGYDGAIAYAPRLAKYRDERDVAVVGPFALEGTLAAFYLTVLFGVLFSLRERGYRRALLPYVSAARLPQLRAAFTSAVVAERVVEQRPPPRVVVAASGSGTNFQAVIDAIEAKTLAMNIVGLIVNRADAYALARAEKAGIPARRVIWERHRQSRSEYDRQVSEVIAESEPELVLLLGWMHVLPPEAILRFPELLNIHPAYLPFDPDDDTVELPDGTRQPAYRGAHAVRDALAMRTGWIGASIHRVTTEVDRGAILARIPLVVRDGESTEALITRLHQAEHRLLISALQTWLADR